MATVVQRSLASGEISQALQKRVDLAKYQNGLRTLRNCIVKKGGGAMNRGGTTYVHGAPDPDTDPQSDYGLPIGASTILVPWESASSADSYVLEFGNGFIRFVKNGARVDIDGVEDWDVATAYAVGDLVCREGANYYCKVAHTGQQPPSTTYWHALYGYEYSIPTPYTTSMLSDRGAFSFVQDSDRMLIAHSSLLPRELVRISDTEWTLTAWPVSSDSPTRYGLPRIKAPTNLQAVTASTQPATRYGVCAVTEDLEESLPAVVDAPAADASNDVVLTWTASTFEGSDGDTRSIKGYNVYKRYQGVLFYLAFVPVGTVTYTDDSTVVPDTDGDSPPETRVELNSTAGTFPKKVGAFEGRTLLGNFSFNVQAIYGSRVGFRQNFTRRFPSGDDDSILFQIKGKQINGIRHFVDIGELLVMTDSGEWIVRGDANGVLTPSPAPVPKQYSAHGASGDVWPIVIGSSAVYVQERGSIVRAAGFDNLAGGKDGYRDDDLTAFCDHLFEGKTIISMAYQKTPHSVLWCVLDDGGMVGLTYIKEQDILAAHRHDMDGLIEDVCCIPEGSEHAVYLIVKRTIGGQDFRYLERMASRQYTDARDAIFCDSALSYDGRNEDTSKTLQLSGGSSWNEDETLTMEANFDAFSELEIGNEYWLTGSDSQVYKLTVTAYTDVRHVTVRPKKTIAVASELRTRATAIWSRAIDTLRNLQHLEGKEVVVQADGDEIANPNIEAYGDPITVEDGEIELEECHAVYHVGLPYISDIETLAIDTVDGRLIGQQKLVTGVLLDLQKTRGVYAGTKAPSDDEVDPLENLYPLKYGNPDSDEAPLEREEFTGEVEVNIAGEWNGNGRVFIRQVSAKPMTVLSIAPQGLFPGGG